MNLSSRFSAERFSLVALPLLMVIAAFCLTGGCGGGGGSSGAGGGGLWGGAARTAKILITLPFPQKGAEGIVKIRGNVPGGKEEILMREIPAGTTYFAIYIYDRGTTENAVPPVRVDRPASGDTATVSISGVPIGWKTIRILASNAANEALAESFFDVNVITGDNPDITMTLTPTMSPYVSPSPMPTPTLSPSPEPSPSQSPSQSPTPSPQPTSQPPGPQPSPSPSPTYGWSKSLTPLTQGATLRGIWMKDAGLGFAVGASGKILKWSGSSWSDNTPSPSLGNLNGVCGRANTTPPNNVHLVIAGDGGKITYSDDQMDWHTTTVDASNRNFHSVCIDNANNVYAVGQGGMIWKYVYASSTWESHTSGTGNILYGVWAADSSNIYACGAGGVVIKGNGASNGWTAMSSSTLEDLISIWGTSTTDIYACGTNRKVIHYTGGAAWLNFSPVAGSETFYSIYGVGGFLYAAGSGGSVFSYNTGWAQVSTVDSNVLYAVWTDGTKTLAVGGNGVCLEHASSSMFIYSIGGGSPTSGASHASAAPPTPWAPTAPF
ncbi:MAG: hypothetical protein RDV48_28880 [Candidatus Eremiobacteraeota bacterium]|nr:hypothetical protein [Candidatus Eremiobacteraeota bacterium]